MAQVIWTQEADEIRRNVLMYGYITFGERSTKKMNAAFRTYENLLASNPLMGRREQLLRRRTDYIFRSILVHRNYKLIYVLEPEDRETAERVLIIDIWDTRMDPDFLAARILATE